MFKNKLKNFFASEILKSYFFTLIILSILLLIMQASKLLYLVTDGGLNINNYIIYVIFLLPKIISQLMLISLLISLFLTIIKFQNNKEIEIYWLSGVGKIEIAKLIIQITFLLTLIAYIFFLYLSPFAGFKSRTVLANSEFSLINSIVKKKNFNSILKDLTIFVNKNDNSGNLEQIYIFENNKTIISKKGRVLNINNKNYLELIDGVIHEKNSKNSISSVKFQKTLYNFTKYKNNIITDAKVQEKKIFDLVNQYKQNKNPDILYEIHKRIFKPLFMPIIAILCCIILFSNNEKINLNKLKIIIFTISTLFLILIEVILNLSIINDVSKYFLYYFPFVAGILLYFFLKKWLINENHI